jgi:hypothetical protein
MIENPGLNLEVFGYNFNGYTLETIYSDLLVGLGVTYSSADAADFYHECWDCVEVISGDYRGVVAWINESSNSSLSSDFNLA